MRRGKAQFLAETFLSDVRGTVLCVPARIGDYHKLTDIAYYNLEQPGGAARKSAELPYYDAFTLDPKPIVDAMVKRFVDMTYDYLVAALALKDEKELETQGSPSSGLKSVLDNALVQLGMYGQKMKSDLAYQFDLSEDRKGYDRNETQRLLDETNIIIDQMKENHKEHMERMDNYREVFKVFKENFQRLTGQTPEGEQTAAAQPLAMPDYSLINMAIRGNRRNFTAPSREGPRLLA